MPARETDPTYQSVQAALRMGRQVRAKIADEARRGDWLVVHEFDYRLDIYWAAERAGGTLYRVYEVQLEPPAAPQP